MPVHTGDEVDLKAVLANLVKGSPTAVALVVVFYLGSKHVEAMDAGHREAIRDVAVTLRALHEEFDRRNAIADRAVVQIERTAHILDKMYDRLLTTGGR